MDIKHNTNNTQKFLIYNIPQNLTVAQFLQKKQHIGCQKFLAYSAYDNN